jgi:hypothetical protein
MSTDVTELQMMSEENVNRQVLQMRPCNNVVNEAFIWGCSCALCTSCVASRRRWWWQELGVQKSTGSVPPREARKKKYGKEATVRN